jgi:carbonic anhydrase/acetyltransferase-like protein (isoleucine patch superfamily)
VGHHVTLHGCTIADHCLIGIGSIVMDGVCIESEVVLGAGSLVPPNKILEGGYLWLGNPAKKIRPLTDKERTQLDYSARYYVWLKDRYTAKPPLIT